MRSRGLVIGSREKEEKEEEKEEKEEKEEEVEDDDKVKNSIMTLVL